ncbi:hypothetical protein PENTCL1PPCAC_8402, partial [Pristionchus entomophagus]
ITEYITLRLSFRTSGFVVWLLIAIELWFFTAQLKRFATIRSEEEVWYIEIIATGKNHRAL